MVPTNREASALQSRNYQLEMLEASLKENIIVAMDTGSGKTHIAVLRIIAELENCPQDRLVWFLAPTVALCIQQHEVISSNIPAVRARTLTGLDNVELWTEQSIWDAVLKDIRVVVSTHAVLLDALSHGFVKMSRLALIIFDEAHHCIRRHPANKIMQDFYHPAMSKYGKNAVPRIMGLTASPVIRSKSNQKELLTVESNLDAVCKTPRMHRQELLTYTYRPELQQLWYSPSDPADFEDASQTLKALKRAWDNLDIEDDPYIRRLRKSPLDGKALQKALLSGKTYCREQLRKFVDRSCHIFEELGGWAADYFIHASTEQLRARINESHIHGDWEDEEKAYLLEFISRLPPPDLQVNFSDPESSRISPKFESLLATLDQMYQPDFSGLIFAKQRATVSVMTRLLSIHPLTNGRFRSASYVGWSNSSNSKDVLGDLLDMKMQRDTLADFRSGRNNLIIATDVLEEGIDISACSVVICYDKPPNLKSFVQRRGRARQKESTYAIMFPVDEDSSDLRKWQDLEKAMVEAYQDDERRLEEAYALESVSEEVMERFTVESTCAVLTADSAMAHLHHFCSVLPAQPYVDNRPVFSFETNDDGLLKATVVLPTCVHPTVRRTEGRRWWLTERAAMKESAFQAYKSLYEFGLVNDHLLPLTKKPELSNDVGDMPSMLEVSDQYDPWVDWAYSWSSPDINQTRIVVQQNGKVEHELFMRLTGPTVLPPLEPMTLFWDNDTTFTLTFEEAERIPQMASDSVENMRTITALYLQATSSRRLTTGQDFMTLFSPDISHTELEAWLHTNEGHDSALEVYLRGSTPVVMGVIRDRSRYNEPLLFRRWLVSERDPMATIIDLECDSLPRRRNLLHRQTLANKQLGIVDEEPPETPTKVRIVSADKCTIDRLSFANAMFGLFISVIVDKLESTLVATRLCETILRDVGFTSTHHVITAITAPSAQGLTNYQRYEFLGDSILKFTVSCQLFCYHPNWHEGYLSERRDAIVQNPRLARAALATGLDAFIINKMFTPRKWSAPLISEKMEHDSGQRQVSMKVLADVVEALIGAAYMDGGHVTAQACIRRFLPEIHLQTLDIRSPTRSAAPESAGDIMNDRLKDLIGYSFNDKSLLVEALTHPSCDYDASTQSYQRLEFLGDAVLDMVIVSAIFKHPVHITQGDMTKIKHAVVNANLMAFFCMEFAIEEEKGDIEQTSYGQFMPKSSTELIRLWEFMRYRGLDLNTGRDASLARHTLLRDEIKNHLQSSNYYPWQALSRLSADKFFSDMIESVLGAIFVDSGGDLAQCEMFVERIGLLSYLRRILTDGVNVTHPRNIAQQLAKSNIQFCVKRIEDEDGSASYKCSVKRDGVEVFAVEGCLTGEEAEVTAALATVEILTQPVQQNGDGL